MIRWTLLLLFPLSLPAQSNNSAVSDDLLKSVLLRLDKLEEQNRALMDEVKSLRATLASATSAKPVQEDPAPSLERRVEVAEHRIEEQAQTKVEASQRFPIRITGALLFNAFANTGNMASTYSSVVTGPEPEGATFRQTLLGLDFNGPSLPGNGTASGSLTLDFAGYAPYTYGATVNLRRAVLNLDWAHRSVIFGQDKPLISRRSPDSLAEVLVPPLANAGNPWIWTPQVRYVERFGNRENMGINVESAVLETEEDLAYVPAYTYATVEKARPAWEERVAFWLHHGDDQKFEFAPGFHFSDSRVNGVTVPSRIATLDWLIQPVRRIQWKGLLFTGENMANLSGFTNGFHEDMDGRFEAVRGAGGWTQVSVEIAPRLTLNALAGFQAPRLDGLASGTLTHDYSFASNLMYRLAPNILLGAEALQERAGYLETSHIIRDHYDLAIGYLF